MFDRFGHPLQIGDIVYVVRDKELEIARIHNHQPRLKTIEITLLRLPE